MKIRFYTRVQSDRPVSPVKLIELGERDEYSIDTCLEHLSSGRTETSVNINWKDGGRERTQTIPISLSRLHRLIGGASTKHADADLTPYQYNLAREQLSLCLALACGTELTAAAEKRDMKRLWQGFLKTCSR